MAVRTAATATQAKRWVDAPRPVKGALAPNEEA
jgi:hypothetical protein